MKKDSCCQELQWHWHSQVDEALGREPRDQGLPRSRRRRPDLAAHGRLRRAPPGSSGRSDKQVIFFFLIPPHLILSSIRLLLWSSVKVSSWLLFFSVSENIFVNKKSVRLSSSPRDNAHAIKAEYIIEASNHPTDPEADEARTPTFCHKTKLHLLTHFTHWLRVEKCTCSWCRFWQRRACWSYRTSWPTPAEWWATSSGCRTSRGSCGTRRRWIGSSRRTWPVPQT